jgi:hypothetical protein
VSVLAVVEVAAIPSFLSYRNNFFLMEGSTTWMAAQSGTLAEAEFIVEFYSSSKAKKDEKRKSQGT